MLSQRMYSSDSEGPSLVTSLGPYSSPLSGEGSSDLANPDGTNEPHELWKQPVDGLCLIYAVMNTFDNIDECHCFLGHRELIGRPYVDLDECQEFLHFAKTVVNEDWKGEKGLSFRCVVKWLVRKAKELGVKMPFTVEATDIDTHQLLLSMKDERNKNYVIFGESAAEKFRDLAADTINGYRRRGRGKKRKIREVDGFADMYHSLKEGVEENKEKSYSMRKADHCSHAVAIKYDANGIPYLYDPGKKVRKTLCPTVHEDGTLATESEVNMSVKHFVDSLIHVTKVYRVDIKFL